MIQSDQDLRLLLEAFDLLDEHLLAGRDPDYRHVVEQRFDHLGDLGMPDEFARFQAVRKQIPARSLFERFDLLARAVFVMEHGHPVLSFGLLSQRLVRFLDPDLLICLHPDAKPAPDDSCDWAATPDLAACGLIPKFGPTVETHLHLGGALPPLYYWCLAMTGNFRLAQISARLIGQDLKRTALWSESLARAAWLRLALANRLRELVADDPFPHLAKTDQVYGYWEGLQALESGCVPEPFREIASRFTKLRQRQSGEPPFRDCLRPNVRQPDGHYAEGERRLMIGIAARRHEFNNGLWETRLRCYIRIRNAFHRLLAYEEGASGLYRFAEGFGQRSSFRFGGPSNRQRRGMLFERDRLAATLDAQLRKPFEPEAVLAGHHRLELRCSLARRGGARAQLFAWVAGIQDFLHRLRGVNCSPDPGFIQFINHHRPDHPWLDKMVERLRLPPVPCPVGIILQLHKLAKHTRREALQNAKVFASLAASFPQLRPLLIGIDTAGAERLTEPRQLSPAYRYLQAFENHFRKAPGEQHDICWGYTYHVGEDCDDFLIGLRHVDEVVHLLLPERGGRIGHGLILGEDPETYYRQRRMTNPHRGPYLLSLVWAWAILQKAGHFPSAQRIHQFLVELLPKLEDSNLHQCAQMLMDPGAESWTPNLAVPGSSCLPIKLKHAASESKLLTTLLGTGTLDPRGLTISPDKRHFDLLREIQHITCQRLLRRRLTIEVNPTSNLLVGGYPNYGDLPYRTMTDAGLELSINTDDAGFFTTNLANEMTLLYRGSLDRGAEDPETRRWIRQMRENAVHSSFLRHALQLQCDPDQAQEQRARMFTPSFL